MARVKRRTVKKGEAPQKSHWKRPGFNAFGAQSSMSNKRRVIKLAKCREVEPPETGIHSLAWANSIAPQESGLLQLPVEVRHRMWFLVLHDLGGQRISPLKKGNIFFSRNWPKAAEDTIALSETSRQIYVDVVGGGLLYKAKQFSFTPGLMLNYLWVINPVHKNSLRSIHLEIKIKQRNFSLPKKAFSMLADLPALQHLHLEFNLHPYLCRRMLLTGGQKVFNNGRFVPWGELAKIRWCKELLEIRVQSLLVEFVSEMFFVQHQDGSRVWRKTNLSAECARGRGRNFNISTDGRGPYFELEEELKEVMVVKKGAMQDV